MPLLCPLTGLLSLSNRHEPTLLREAKSLGIDGFSTLMMHESPLWHRAVATYDMTRPLHQYFINASHNTLVHQQQSTR